MRLLSIDDVRLNHSGRVVAAPAWAFELSPALGYRFYSRIEPAWEPLYAMWRQQGADRLAALERERDDPATDPKWRREVQRLIYLIKNPPRRERAAASLSYPRVGSSRLCIVCGSEFFGLGKTEACTNRCAKIRRDATRTRGEPRRAERAPRECGHCGERFHPARADARFCSGRCRVAAHRVHARGSGV